MSDPKTPEFLASLEAMIDDPDLPLLDGLIPALVQRLSPIGMMLHHRDGGWSCLIISGASTGTQHVDLREALRIEVRRYCEAHEKMATKVTKTAEAQLAYDRAFEEARKYAPSPASARALLHLVASSDNPHRFRPKEADREGSFLFPILDTNYNGSYVVLRAQALTRDTPTVADHALNNRVTVASLELIAQNGHLDLRRIQSHFRSSVVQYHAQLHADVLAHFRPLLHLAPAVAPPPGEPS